MFAHYIIWREQLKPLEALYQPRARRGPRAGSGPLPYFVRPATLFCPARELFLNYNGNRPAACHRPPLHYTIEGLSCLPLHRLKTNVITTFILFDNALLNARWIVWILISNGICRSFIPLNCVIRREMVVAQSGGFSEIVVARSGGFSQSPNAASDQLDVF